MRVTFNRKQLKLVRSACREAAELVTSYYRLAPREWRQMPYEVKTLRRLGSSEILDCALAHTLCYGFERKAGPLVLNRGELYRICLQDHCIIEAAEKMEASLEPVLTYVLTHELVHVVRFGQKLQSPDLPYDLRPDEEMSVEKTTHRILSATGKGEFRRILLNSPLEKN